MSSDAIKAVAQSVGGQPTNLRVTQGVVTAVSEPTCSVRIAGSTVSVDGIYHVDSCAPGVGDVVWILSDGSDLWIIGTHGTPLFRTSATGGRVEIDSVADVRRVRLFSGSANESYPGGIGSLSVDANNANVEIAGPDFGAGCATIALYGAGSSKLALNGDDVQVNGKSILNVPNPPYCAVRRLSDQSVVTSSNTPVDFLADALVEADTHGMFATAAPDRLTIKVPGVYHFEGNIAFAANATGLRAAWIRVNANNTLRYVYMQLPGNGVYTQFFVVSCDVGLAENNYVQLMVYQTSGAALASLTVAAMTPRLTARWVRPPT